MKTYQAMHRSLAASCYVESKHDINIATTEFLKKCKSLKLKLPRAVGAFVKRWGVYYLKHKHTDGSASNSGRKPKISMQAARQLVSEMKRWQQLKRNAPFSSVRELQLHSPKAKAILEATQASHSTTIRAMKRADPELQYRHLCVKQKLTSKQKEERVRVAQEHLAESDSKLETVVFIDAKTMYMHISSVHGWVNFKKETPYETTRPKSKQKPITLKYYIAVCARAGGVLLQFYTGTTGMPANRDPSHVYLVSQPLWSLASIPACACCNAVVIVCSHRRLRPCSSPGHSHTT